MQEQKGKKTKKGIFFMALGLVLVALAGSLFAYNNAMDVRAGERAKAIFDAVAESRNRGEFKTASDGEKTIEIDGMKCIGTIEIPSLEIELPVQSEWSKPALKMSPCRYSGSLLEGSLIICGHNYQNHFGKLKYIENGDTVIITDATGTDYKYKVSSITVLGGNDVEEMENNDGWDMTLFTCDYSGRNRIAIRCIRA
jgi:sortase A